MDISTAYKQHQQILNIQQQITEVRREIKQVDFAYKVAFVGTFALYFCFIWGMYIADLWGFSTWLTQNISEVAALVVYGILAIALPLTMALIKEIAYRHFSNYPNSTGMIILIVGILALAGVVYESITSSSQQQHMSFKSAENSKTFDAIASSGASVDTGSLASLIGSAEAKLAKCKKMVERGAWSDCAESEARLNGYLESEQRSMQSAERAGVQAIEAKTSAIQELKEENHKPVFKAIRDSFGVSINTGIMTVTIFVSAIFEVSHLLLILLLAQKKQRLAGLDAGLINNETDYMRSTGKTFKPEDFSDDSVLDMNEVREKSPAPIGFGSPAMAFKYQEPKKQQAGFVWEDSGNKSNNIQGNRPAPVSSKSTWNAGLEKTGIDSPDDSAMNQSADKAQIERILSRGQSVSKASEKASEKAFRKASDDRTRSVPNGFKKASDKLYPVWVNLLKEGAIKPTVRPAKKLISEQLCSQRKAETITPAQIDLVIKEWISKALTAGIIKENKGASNGQAKYSIA